MPGQEVTRIVAGLVSDQTMIVIGGVLLFFVLVLSLLRFKKRMAGLIHWITDVITGARASTTESESVKNNQDSEKPSAQHVSKLKGTKTHQNINKPIDEPTFSTNLTTPIEDIIKESITEEKIFEVSQPPSRKKGKSKSQLNKQKSEDSTKANRNQNKEDKEEDSLGHSVLKPKSLEAVKSEKVSKKRTSVKANIDKSSLAEEQDDVGFSFFPVREKSRRHKGKSALEKSTAGDTLNTVVEQSLRKTKEDLLKPSIIDHYQKKETKQIISETVVSKKSISNLENIQNFDLTNRLEENRLENQNRFELKKSKKVSSTISYANVVTHNFTEKIVDTDILDSQNQTKKASEGESTNAFEKIETDIQISKKLQSPTLTETKVAENKSKDLDTQFQENDNFYNNPEQAISTEEVAEIEASVEENLDNIFKSNSSSIEAHFKESDRDHQKINSKDSVKKLQFKESHHKSVQPDIIKDVTTKIASSNSTFDHFDQLAEKLGNSGSSSVYVRQNQTEAENPSGIYKESSIEGTENISAITTQLLEEIQREITLDVKEVEDTVSAQEEISVEEQLNQDIKTGNILAVAQYLNELQQEIIEQFEPEQETSVEEQLEENIQIENLSEVTVQLSDELQQEILETEELIQKVPTQEETSDEDIQTENILEDTTQEKTTTEIEQVEDKEPIEEETSAEDQLSENVHIKNISTVTTLLLEELEQEKTIEEEQLNENSQIENISAVPSQFPVKSQQEITLKTEREKVRVVAQEETSVEERLGENIHLESILLATTQLLEEPQGEVTSQTKEVEDRLATQEETSVQGQLSEYIQIKDISAVTALLEKLEQEITSAIEEEEHKEPIQETVEEQVGDNIQIEGTLAVTTKLLEEPEQKIILKTEDVEEEISVEKQLGEHIQIKDISAVTAQFLEKLQQEIASAIEEEEHKEPIQETVEEQVGDNIQIESTSAVTTKLLEEPEQKLILKTEDIEEQLGENIQIKDISAVTAQFLEKLQQEITSAIEEEEHKEPIQQTAEEQLVDNIQIESTFAVTTQLPKESQRGITLETKEVEDKVSTQKETLLKDQEGENIELENILPVTAQVLGKSQEIITSNTEETQDRVPAQQTLTFASFNKNFSGAVVQDYTSSEIYNKAVEDSQQIEESCVVEKKINTQTEYLDNSLIFTGGDTSTILTKIESSVPVEGESVNSVTYLESVNVVVSEPLTQEASSNSLDHLINQIVSAEVNYTNSTSLQNLEAGKEESSKLIEEEKCLKKTAYTTGNFISEPQVLEDNAGQNLNMTSLQQIRVLTLNNQEHQECTLFRIEKNWIIQFRLGPSLFGRKVYLYCNYPVENNGTLVQFNRSQYQLLNWMLDEGCKNADDTAAYTQILAKLAGSFHYYFTFENGENAERHGSGYFLVDPVLKYGNNEELLLDCVQCQTVLAKNLGSFSSWEKKLQVAKESGYNMIHFSPIQELGASNSCYSLSEQLKLNPDFKKENGEMPTFKELEEFMLQIRRDWKITTICDIVLNHTANESEWIKKHPEVTYNCENCPYMRPAYLLDAALHQFSIDVKNGLYEDKGIPTEINSEEHLNAIRYHFRTGVLEPLKLQELFTCESNKLVVDFLSLARITTPVSPSFMKKTEELKLIQDSEYRRLAATIDMKLAQRLYNVYWNDTFDEDSRLKKCAEELKSKLDSLNNEVIEKIDAHLNAAIENIIASIRYFRVQADGPRVKEISSKNPLVYRYFTDYGAPKSLKEHEEIMYSSNGCFLMAHNGWVMNSDPLKNFAAPDSNVYLRRELIAWGDSVKLRFGDKPKDCPFLWDYMRKYVEQTAKIFDGVRLDNCHSTPIPVAEYLLDCARKIKPDLYVVAELFTNSDMTDNIFVNRLGITSLIREAMSAWDSHEEGRLVYRYGGYPVGSFYQPSIQPLVPSIAHALFLDLTHDNPSPVEKRSVFDLLPSTALVNMACCASGSNRGYDELVPHHIHVVDETRQYTEWTDDENLAKGNPRYVTKRSGIIAAKRAINDLHFTLGKEGFNQVYVDQMDPDIVAVTRHCPETHQSYILVAFTAFGYPNEDAGIYQRGIKPLRVEGVLEEIVLEATLSHVSYKTEGSKFAKWDKFIKDSKWINGLSEYQINLKQHINVDESDVFEKVDSGTRNVTQLNFKDFKPGSVVVIKVSLPEAVKESVDTVRALVNSITKNTELSQIINKLTLVDLNRIIYRCDQEERDEGFGFDTYHIPNFGSTVYAGLQGFISLLANIRPNNDLGHPMCSNLRDGNWMIEYIWKRLKLDEGTRELGEWIEEHTKCFNNIPRYLVPCYFDAVITGIYICLIEQSYKLMSDFVNHGSTFVRGLSLGSVQFLAYIRSADLPALSPNLAPPKPPTRKNDKGETIQSCATLSAGLPHFSVGYMRNWGRDTFIALRGLLILTGRYEEARQHILGYAACLRHGLIPNLLDGGRNSRFNCRDAVWWWLYCIKEYVEETPNGINILNDNVSRIFPTDDSPAQLPGVVDQPLYEVIQEALTIHFQGLAFRERNAGRQIDEHMTDRGFNNQIGIHPETGFVFGGNEWNCGTWMDKMGSSDKAGNRGKPATPRDGSAVELVGLSKAVVTWLSKLNQENKYPYAHVQRTHKNGSITKWTFKEWSEKIQANFEKYFWINVTPIPNEIKPNLINKRGIYKDCYGATQEWSDFQLRCNFPIAMVLAPELFTPQHAWVALNQAEKYLVGPLGMKTLDPEDMAYRGDYDNSDDSNDPSVAHGFNYHQGPEWVWPIGYFLRAKLHFASLNGALKETLASTKLILSKHFTELQTSLWRGLPELTNSNGLYCRDSSRTQAWSIACILEVLNDLQKIESTQPTLVN